MSTAQLESDRVCLECGNALSGRVDKKFCTDQCRNTYNNKGKQTTNVLVRTITAVLKKNRRILAGLNPDGKKKVQRERLLKLGFDFTYITEVYTTKDGNEYRYCFEQGYRLLDNDWYLLVHKLKYER